MKLAEVEDEELLLQVLNSAPVVAGRSVDALAGDPGLDWIRDKGGQGVDEERERLRAVREVLQTHIRDGSADLGELRTVVEKARLRPALEGTEVTWRLEVAADAELAVRVVLAWSRVTAQLPGRLRACANAECNLFLLDRSRPGTARWCSMAVCGNRMKARAHVGRRRATTD
ncbi:MULTISPECIES: CGNR zinc finger domain-containing protein [unclassified Streptomyces]|uniref:CGNR zinc finger domain-containing protein n=1 Tax=unclassified Streptomyces TaxID=2593676 RepID=UPI000CD5838B|nr:MULTISPECIES: CGNR zinc finger domain-containing protein [unclassified Streptomyces]